MKYKILFLSLFLCAASFAQKIPNYSPDIQLEHLGRGFVAYRTTKPTGSLFTTICLSWRYLKTDSLTTTFNVYKAPVTDGVAGTPTLLGAATNATFYRYSESSDNSMCYSLYEVVNGVENPEPLAKYTLPAYNSSMGTANLNYIEIPMKPVQGALNSDKTWEYSATSTDNASTYAYAPNDASFADLDGDGELEMVIHRVGPNAQDNANSGKTDAPVLQAYKLDGTFMWEINLGKNIREGAHYTQFMVYDLDGDGKAEVVCKTAEGTIDAAGTYVGEKYFPDYVKAYSLGSLQFNPNANYRNSSGYILSGPEFLTVFNGETGTEIVTTAYDPPRYSAVYNNGNEVPVLSPTTSQINSRWGDNYGNRVDRFLACIAYLDGIHPSVVMCRGYYTRTVLVAYDFDGTNLTKRWKFDTYNSTKKDPNGKPYSAYEGQGCHSLRVGDVDGDGKDEIIYGACCIDDDGSGLYTTGLGHGDALHLTDFIPERPGLEVLQVHESGGQGTTLRDARTGEIINQILAPNTDVGRGLGTDISSSQRGLEYWSTRSNGIINATTSTAINSSTSAVSMNMAVWWDGDLSRELEDGTSVTKYNNGTSQTLLNVSAYCGSNNSTKATPCIAADILGDWREEVAFRTLNNKAVRIYMTDQTTNFRFHTFLQDPVYRMSVAYQNVAYNQPTHPGFYMGTDLQNIFVPTSINVDGTLDEYVVDPFFDAIWYQWSDGVSSKTDTLRRADFPEDGSAQKVKLTMNYHGFLFSDSINVSFAPKSQVGIVKVEADKSTISLLNNPVDDIMNISFDKAGLYDCYFYDTTGKLTMKTTLSVYGKSVQSINVSSLPAGMGIVEIKNNEIKVTKKFLKKQE